MAAPLLWVCGISILIFIYFVASPEWIFQHFSQKGRSYVEIATVTLFFFQMFFLWIMPPVPLKPVKAKLLALDYSIITFFAICRELDWHKTMIDVSGIEGATRGTPFKMRFLTNPNNPLADRLLVLFCFIIVIALCGLTLLWYIRPLIKGLLRFHPVCWSIGFLGGSVIVINTFDRMGSILRKDFKIELSESTKGLICLMEEGQEIFLPLFVIIAVIQSHFIYNNDGHDDLQQFRDL